MAITDKRAISDDEIYPNSPLSDVACEVRFTGEMQVECERHRFWDAIRDDYPKILVPFAKEGQATTLQHYRFRSEDDGRSVQVALNSLAYSETKYRGHEKYLDEFLRLIAIFRKTYPKLGTVKRVGWRYINLMPFTPESGLLPLNRLLKFEMDLPLRLFKQTAKIDLQWSGRHEDMVVIIRLSNVPRKDFAAQQALLLDIDYAKEDATLSWDEVAPILKKARSGARETFEKMITDDYREYLRGNTL